MRRVIAAHDLYCCLLAQCEALRMYATMDGFLIARNKWCCDQDDKDVKVVLGAAFTKT